MPADSTASTRRSGSTRTRQPRATRESAKIDSSRAGTPLELDDGIIPISSTTGGPSQPYPEKEISKQSLGADQSAFMQDLSGTKFYPGLNDMADALEAMPMEIIRHFTLLREIDAKCVTTTPELTRLIKYFLDLPLPARALEAAAEQAGGPNKISLAAQNKIADLAREREDVLRTIRQLIRELMPCLEEKMHVAGVAADAIARHVARLDYDFDNLIVANNEIPHEVRYGPKIHQAYLPIITAAEQKQAHSTRSEARREAMAARKAAAAAAQAQAQAHAQAAAAATAVAVGTASAANGAAGSGRSTPRTDDGTGKSGRSSKSGAGGSSASSSSKRRKNASGATGGNGGSGSNSGRNTNNSYSTNHGVELTGVPKNGAAAGASSTSSKSSSRAREADYNSATSTARKRSNAGVSGSSSGTSAKRKRTNNGQEEYANGAGTRTQGGDGDKAGAAIKSERGSRRGAGDAIDDNDNGMRDDDDQGDLDDSKAFKKSGAGGAVPSKKKSTSGASGNGGSGPVNGASASSSSSAAAKRKKTSVSSGGSNGSGTSASSAITSSGSSNTSNSGSSNSSGSRNKGSKKSSDRGNEDEDDMFDDDEEVEMDEEDENDEDDERGSGGRRANSGAAGKPSSSASNAAAGSGESEQVYCYCQQVSYGAMVACDGPHCKNEWFHLPCIGLTSPPEGQWFCRDCKKEIARQKRNSQNNSSNHEDSRYKNSDGGSSRKSSNDASRSQISNILNNDGERSRSAVQGESNAESAPSNSASAYAGDGN